MIVINKIRLPENLEYCMLCRIYGINLPYYANMLFNFMFLNKIQNE